MVNENGTKIPADPKTITCLDDLPELARRSMWQQRITRSYKLVALAPFAVVIFIVLKFFPNSTSRLGVVAVFLTLGWAIAIAGYAFYSLFWGVHCPVCGSGFGVRDSCRSCDLPRHSQSATMFDFAEKIRLLDKR